MALYEWRGIDIQALEHKGVNQAHSAAELDKQLFSVGISLLSATIHNNYYPIRVWKAVRHEWFLHLAHLLDAGIQLPQALVLMQAHEQNNYLKIVWHDIAQELLYGESLVSAIKAHTPLFDPLVVHLLAAAHETSELSTCLLHIAHYYASLNTWKKELRVQLMGPLMTLMLCALISLFIFMIMLPLFESFFHSADRSMNTTSRLLFYISHWLRHWGIVSGAFCLFAVVTVRIMYKKSIIVRSKVYSWLEHVPFIGIIVRYLAVYQLLSVVSLLLEAHLSLKSCFELLVQHYRTQSSLSFVIDQVYTSLLQGSSLAEAFETHNYYFNKEIIAYIRIGEQSTRLPFMLKKASEVSYDNVLKRLTVTTYYAQPGLLLFIGVLISLLIICVYMPIINVAYTIG